MQRTLRAGDLIVIGAAAAIALALTGVSVWLAPPPSVDLRASTFATHAAGAKAAFLLLERLGYRVQRSFEPVAIVASRVDPADAVLIIASPLERPSKQDVRAVRRFIERGGIVLATGTGSAFLPDMPPLIARRFYDLPPRSYRAVVADALTRDAPAVRIATEIRDGLALTGNATAYKPAYTNGDEAGVLTMRLGGGRAVWWIGSSPLSNREIREPGHMELLLNALGPPDRVVLWDEHCHGYSRGFWSYVAATPLPVALAQLGLIGVMAVFTFSRRRGPIRTLAMDPRASAMEFVEAIAALYQKAGATTGAVETSRTRLRRLLITGAQLPAGSSDEQVAKAAAVRYAIDEDELRDLLAASAAAAETRTLPPARALALVQRAQAVAATVLAHARHEGP